MFYRELTMGDWFKTRDCDTKIYIKLEDNTAVLMTNVDLNEIQSNDTGYRYIFEQNQFVEFVPKFRWDSNQVNTALIFSNNEEVVDDEINHFEKVPIGAIYKSTGTTIYKKIDAETCVAIYSINQIGAIYSRKANSRGYFYLCEEETFYYPEKFNFK